MVHIEAQPNSAKSGHRLFEIAGTNRPFAKEDGDERITEKADEDKTDHRPLTVAGSAGDEFFKGEFLAAGDHGSCRILELGDIGTAAGERLEVALAEKIEAEPQDPVKDYMDDEPDEGRD